MIFIYISFLKLIILIIFNNRVNSGIALFVYKLDSVHACTLGKRSESEKYFILAILPYITPCNRGSGHISIGSKWWKTDHGILLSMVENPCMQSFSSIRAVFWPFYPMLPLATGAPGTSPLGQNGEQRTTGSCSAWPKTPVYQLSVQMEQY